MRAINRQPWFPRERFVKTARNLQLTLLSSAHNADSCEARFLA